jgi:hypothetical protein
MRRDLRAIIVVAPGWRYKGGRAVGARPLGRVTARGGALTAAGDVLQLVLDLGQPAAQVGVFRLQVGDPLLEGGDMGQDFGLGLRRDRVPEGCGDRRSSSHTLYL